MCGSIRIHWFRVTCLAEAAGGRSTSGVVEPPIAHGAAPVWAGDVRADPDEVQEVRVVDVQSLNAAGFEVHEVHDADVQNLNAAGFEGQEVHDADDQNLDAIGFEV